VNKEQKVQKIKACLAIAVIFLMFGASGMAMVKYQVEGETNMPFELTKITVISTAEGVQTQEATTRWSLDLVQDNDIYFVIEKNKEYTQEDSIKSVSIENLKMIEAPKMGTVRYYMPQSEEGSLFAYREKYLFQENLTFKGASKTNLKNLEIGSQGGTIAIRVADARIGQFLSDEDDVIKHDGTILKKANLKQEDLQCKIMFDFLIEVNNKTLKTNIVLDLPSGNIVEEGTCSFEKTDFSDVVFKRI